MNQEIIRVLNQQVIHLLQEEDIIHLLIQVHRDQGIPVHLRIAEEAIVETAVDHPEVAVDLTTEGIQDLQGLQVVQQPPVDPPDHHHQEVPLLQEGLPHPVAVDKYKRVIRINTIKIFESY
jgi:hypothetical protein